MCDTVGAANYSESTTKHKCDTAQTCKYGKKNTLHFLTRNVPLLHSLSVLSLFISRFPLSPHCLCNDLSASGVSKGKLKSYHC